MLGSFEIGSHLSWKCRWKYGSGWINHFKQKKNSPKWQFTTRNIDRSIAIFSTTMQILTTADLLELSKSMMINVGSTSTLPSLDCTSFQPNEKKNNHLQPIHLVDFRQLQSTALSNCLSHLIGWQRWNQLNRRRSQ